MAGACDPGGSSSEQQSGIVEPGMWRGLGLAGVFVATVAGAARPPGPPPCPDVPFVADSPLLDPSAPPDTMTVDTAGQVSIPGACAAVPARWRRRSDGTVQLRARWAACGAVMNVRLRMRYDAACASATGRLTARRHPRVIFTATAGGVSATTTTLGGGTTPTTLGGLFEAPNPWNRDVSALPVASESASIIGALAAAGGWGSGNNLQIDFALHLLHTVPTTPFVTFQKSAGYYSPDCDEPFPFPQPAGGAIEGQGGYTCPVASEDCHLLVVDAPAKRLYEMYNVTTSGGTLVARCGLFWDLTRAYPPSLRGEQCTSTDAAGFPIAALLFTADEVAAGNIPHAIRFILPNARMRSGVYVRPASHAGAPSGGPDLPPYGVRFRLRADFPLATLPSEGARVVARAMQRYGMLLADGGNIALTAASDRFTTHTWDEVGIDSHSLFGIAVADMEVVDLGSPISLTYDCVRNP